MIPFTRETARPHIGRMIKKKDGSAGPIKIFGITDEGFFLGNIEGGPFITYEWALENAVFVENEALCGTEDGKDVLTRQVNEAREQIKDWPEWKKNILVDNGKPTVSEPRKPVINK